MQTKKEEVLNAIVTHSYQEFRENGFQKASMRSIAKRGRLNLANIYNYFKSKDEIFKEVLKPILIDIENYLCYMKPENYPNIFSCDLNEHIQMISEMATYLDRNRDAFHLLIFQAAGSSLENYKDFVIDEYTKICLEYSKIISVHETGKEYVVSEFVAHNIAGTWANFIVESLMHDLSKEEMIRHGQEMMIFMYGGWNALMCPMKYSSLEKMNEKKFQPIKAKQGEHDEEMKT